MHNQNIHKTQDGTPSLLIYVCHEAQNRNWALMIMEHLLSKRYQVKLWEYRLPFPQQLQQDTYFLLLPFLKNDQEHPTEKAFSREWHQRTIYLLKDDSLQKQLPLWLTDLKCLSGIEKLNSNQLKHKKDFYKNLIENLDQIIAMNQKLCQKSLTEQTSLQDIKTSKKLTQLYGETRHLLQFRERENLRDQFIQVQKKIQSWSKLFVQASQMLDNLYFCFLDTIEEQKPSEITSSRFIITLSLDSKKLKNTGLVIEFLDRAFKDLTAKEDIISLGNLSDSILSIPTINLRNGNEQDFALMKSSLSGATLSFQKRAINNLLLLSKLLIKGHAEASRNLAWLHEKQTALRHHYHNFDDCSLLESLITQKFNQFKARLENQESIKKEFYNQIYVNEEISLAIRNRFISFMEKSFFRLINDLRQAKQNYQKAITDQFFNHPNREALEIWGEIFGKLELLLKNALTDLGISPIAPIRGQEYNPDFHNPYIKAEPDPELKNDQIKETLNWGFILGNDTLKSADVIVVRN